VKRDVRTNSVLHVEPLRATDSNEPTSEGAT
jgi:hypothetical protein